MITSGPEHARQRDTLGRPIWNDPRTPGIAQRRAAATVAAWREGEPVDVWRAFRRLHFETDWEQLTGEQADEPVLRALETGDVWQPRLIQPGGTLLWRLPTGRGARKASALIDERVDALVAQRRRAPDPTAVDQLSRLVRQAAEDGVTTDEQLRATVKLQFPDPIHDFLTWIFWALARNPVVEERWLEEIDRVLAGAPATLEDVARLPYVHRVLLETMRLYPPAFGIFREALQDLDIGGPRDPGRRRRRHEPVGDAPRSAPVGRPAALRSGSVGRGRAAPARAHLLPVLGRPTRLSRLAAGAARGDGRRGDGQPAVAPAGRERQGAGVRARHRPAAETTAPARPRRAVDVAPTSLESKRMNLNRAPKGL